MDWLAVEDHIKEIKQKNNTLECLISNSREWREERGVEKTRAERINYRITDILPLTAPVAVIIQRPVHSLCKHYCKKRILTII